MQIEKINKLIDIIIDTYIAPNDSFNCYIYNCPYCHGYKTSNDWKEDILMSDIKHDKDCMYSIAIDLKKDIQRIRKLNRINS